MPNRYFTEPALEPLLHPERWRFVSTLFPGEVAPVQHPAHRAWMENHTECHGYRELLVPLQGQSVYSYRGSLYPCEPGLIFLFDVQDRHDTFYPPHTTGCVHLWLNLLPPAAIARVLAVAGGKCTTHASMVIHDPALLGLLNSGWTAAADSAIPAPVRRARLTTAVSAVLLDLVNQGYTSPATSAGNDHHAEVVRQVIRHMAESGGRHLTVDRLARIAGYSKYHFLRLFKKHSGRTVRNCIDESCLIRVAALRREGRNHSEIAAALGFSSLTVYSRWRKNAERKHRGSVALPAPASRPTRRP